MISDSNLTPSDRKWLNTYLYYKEGLKVNKGSIYKTAKWLDVSRKTLYNYVRKHPELRKYRDASDEKARKLKEAKLIEREQTRLDKIPKDRRYRDMLRRYPDG